MFSAEDQQVEICLLKSNLEEIENKIIIQRSALPALDAENKQKSEEAMTVLREVRFLKSTIEKAKQKNLCLTAKRVQLKRQCQELSEDLDTARMNRDKLTSALKEEDREIELHIRQYEDSLQEKAERFRKYRGYYDKAEVNRELESINNVVDELKTELSEKQSVIDALTTEAEGIRPEVPENVIEICGKSKLDDTIKALNSELEALTAKLL